MVLIFSRVQRCNIKGSPKGYYGYKEEFDAPAALAAQLVEGGVCGYVEAPVLMPAPEPEPMPVPAPVEEHISARIVESEPATEPEQDPEPEPEPEPPVKRMVRKRR